MSLKDRNPVLEVHRGESVSSQWWSVKTKILYDSQMTTSEKLLTALMTKLRQTITNSKKSLSCEEKNSKIKQAMRF